MEKLVQNLSEKDIAEGIQYVMDFYGPESTLAYKDWFNEGKGMTIEQATEAVNKLSYSWDEIGSIEREMVRDYVFHKHEGEKLENLEWGNHIRTLIS